MKCLYEHDEEADYVEIQLTEKELRLLLSDEHVTKDNPAMLHTKRLTNICIRREPCR